MLKLILSTDFFFSMIRITAPILLATLAAVICEKGGISNIGLEGTMMLAALFGSLTSYYAKSWAIGLLVAIIVGVLVSALMCFFIYNLQVNMILTGTAINMIGGGGTIFLVKIITGLTEGKQMTSTTGLITQNLLIPTWDIPLIKDIPFIGQVLSGHCILTYISFLLVFVLWVILYKTPLGLNIRSVGENPNAASSVGVSVLKVKYITFMIGGVFCGLAGGFMSIYYSMGWSQGMLAGRGFIALAAQAMGPEPVTGMLASLIFGFAQALRIKFSAVGIDSNICSTIPYIITIIGLVVFAIRAQRNEKKRRSAEALKN